MKNVQNLSSHTDEQLVQSLQQGNKLAMGELYSRYYMLVFAKCLSFVKNTDDASDLAQDVMLRVMEKAAGFKGESKFSTWLYSVTFNYCTDKLRKAKSKHFEPIHEHFDMEDDADAVQELEVAMEQIVQENVWQTISEEDQQLLMMKYQQNMSIKDLQLMYNLSASAVKMRLMRAREKAVTLRNLSLLGHAA
ncbi:sigma-70 family RNA polymerase sigma factor [Reichenbachiella agarivorans]|uniref:Sigma-70 family RNA polymerase sigma factor n=1 Tax=Reichenbachiella agarivorans TaxID=2979464 RepID=A0ABY6CP23_9BACT|nr:sigma-70 family RNA polymerase sigma factor [Reichenbachiella agarivorans]UXP31780.1 sigma-70 family RNA polymerase sigma factor [Reichenbachiella agarivorans]